ncbi:hybrid sensor histidine kinase/response regulator [Roseicella aquatilis]|uniref:histidine kinase n=1 Tax=Roseicella aquatilis TaxID=2527868 RepID=A0A4R4D2W2_9PROT|nr:PAS domain-containing sensor histidine kinase [Roseicella aquatilis]TCZ53380.1 PAS domain-containing sensor histidine kinase [Roseicella aquatilis]
MEGILGAGLTERDRLFADAVADHAVYLLDPEGRISSWNDSAARFTGYGAEEIIGADFSRFFTEEDRAAGLPAAILAEAEATGRHEAEGWRLRKDGSRVLSLGVLDAIRDREGRLVGFAKVTRDMRAWRRVQDALLESERRFRLLVQGVTDYAIFMLDTEGRISSWNAGAERIKGYSPAEAIGSHFSRFYTAEDRRTNLPARALATAIRTGRFEGEGWRLRRDGSRFWASVAIQPVRDEDGRLIGFAKVTRDMTERRRAQQALEESERRFRLLVQGVTDYAIFMLDLDGRVSNWNAGAERIKGYSAEEVVGQHFSRFWTEEDREAGLPGRALVIAAGEGRFECEGWRVRKDGTRFWASVIIDPIREDGRLVGFAKVTRDITERRAAQQTLDEMREQLAQSQRLEAVGQLTGGVAHDFNNLLQIITGGLRLIERRIPKEALQAGEIIASVRQAAARGADLTRQLLAFSRRLPMRTEAIRTAERVREAAALAARSLRGDIRIEVDVPDRLWTVMVDPTQFELALLNVAINARDAMPQGGLLRFEAENVTLDDVRGGLEGDFVAVRVADTGTGIPRELLERVMEPFFTTKPVGQGTGLGLSQAYGFAKQSGGTLGIESELGRGTTVTFTLPASLAAVPVPLGGATAAAARGPSLRVLVVEDEPAVARLAVGLLQDAGHRATAVADPVEALALLERSAAHLDLVFADALLPGAMSGTDLAREIRTRWPRLPVLLATGCAEAEAEGETVPVIRRPYTEAELSRAVAEAVRGAAAG